MPKNRRGVPREERVAEILAAAGQRFLAQGYRATSIGDIAKDVGVANGAIHWYFATKDDLFAATFRSLVNSSLDAESDSTRDPEQTLVDFLVEREPFRLLHHDAHALLDDSPIVAEAHDAMHEQLDELLLQALRNRLPDRLELGVVEDMAHYLLEGVMTAPQRGKSIQEVLSFVLDGLAAASLARASL